MFQLKLDDIELVSKPEYYRKYIIAIIGDPRMLKTEGCAPSVAQRENQHPQPHGPRADDPDRFGPDYRIKFVRSFSYLLHGGSLPSSPSFVERVVACTPARKIVDLEGWDRRTRYNTGDPVPRDGNSSTGCVGSIRPTSHDAER